MTSDTYYRLDSDDQVYAKRLGECLNTIQFVFTHNPELRIFTKDERKKMDGGHEAHPHRHIFNNALFTLDQLKNWSWWVDQVVDKGTKSIALQPEAYRTGHAMALARFRETADDFLKLFGCKARFAA